MALLVGATSGSTLPADSKIRRTSSSLSCGTPLVRARRFRYLRSSGPLNTSTFLMVATSHGILGPYTAIAGRTTISVLSAPDSRSLACCASQRACARRGFLSSGPSQSCLPLYVRIGSLLCHLSESIAYTPVGPTTRWSMTSRLLGIGRASRVRYPARRILASCRWVRRCALAWLPPVATSPAVLDR